MSLPADVHVALRTLRINFLLPAFSTGGHRPLRRTLQGLVFHGINIKPGLIFQFQEPIRFQLPCLLLFLNSVGKC
jgi:hypothetical protein